MTQTDNNRLPYAAPRCEVMEIETTPMMIAMSGNAPDSDDSEFGTYGYAAQRRGTWGDLWADNSGK